MKRLCVFCGSNPGDGPEFVDAAVELATTLVRRGYGMVYGGAHVGLMGALADAALAAGGEVTGVIPGALVERELAHTGLSDLRVVDSMHERKATMAACSDGFVALPGGLGTLEEIFEVLTWAQLGIHSKPCGLLNVGGYFDPLLEFLDGAVAHRFVRPRHRDMLYVELDAMALIDRFEAHQAPEVANWLDPAQS